MKLNIRDLVLIGAVVLLIAVVILHRRVGMPQLPGMVSRFHDAPGAQGPGPGIGAGIYETPV